MVVVRRPPAHPATLADLEALPPGVKGEIIEGVLYTQPRPRPQHQDVAGALTEHLRGPMQRGGSHGPGGWWILVEPGIHLPGEDQTVRVEPFEAVELELGGWWVVGEASSEADR